VISATSPAMGACSCGEPRPPHSWRYGWARGYCGTCYRRWARQGFPRGGPLPPAPRAPRASRAARIEDYTELRSWGVPDTRAAERLGVSTRTVLRYKQQLRQKAGAP
jgi:hypothetical protein